MTSGLLASFLLALAMLLPASSFADAPLRVIINDVAPYTLHGDPERPGMHAEIIKLLSRQSGIPMTISWGPYARLAPELRFGHADLAVGIEGPELEGMSRRIAPFHSFRFVVISRRQESINSLARLKGRLLGVARGAFYDERIDNDADIGKYELKDPFQGVRMLAAGRLDAVISSDYLLAYALKQTGLDTRTFRPPFVVNEKHYVLYAGRQLDEIQSQKLVYSMNLLHKSGQIAAILKTYQQP